MCAPASTVTRAGGRRSGRADDTLGGERRGRRLQPFALGADSAADGGEVPFDARQTFGELTQLVGRVGHQLRGPGHVFTRVHASGDVDRGLRVRPAPRHQLDGIEADADQQVGPVENWLLQHGVREDASEARVPIRHHALRLVRDHRGNAVPRAERTDGRGIAGTPRPQSREQQRPHSSRQSQVASPPVDRPRVTGARRGGPERPRLMTGRPGPATGEWPTGD